MMTISIVIPAHNEERAISDCLRGFIRQRTQHPFEVILVDNCSTDRTVEIANTFTHRLPLKIVPEPRKGRGAARWRGFAVATGDVILSTDADCVVPPDWVETYARIFEKRPTVVAVTGCPQLTDCAPWRIMVFNFFVPYLLLINRVLFGHVGLSGFSFGVRKAVYDQAGGFDPHSDAYEDLELGIRIHRLRQGKITWTLRSAVLFSGRRFRSGFTKGCWEYFTAFVDKFILHKEHVVLSDVK